MGRKICLNMIVKNESHIIQETFDNLLKYLPIDYWVISDTGSTDNTRELIKEYFKKKKIPGELVEHSWHDFGYNRTKALEAAYNQSDYLFIFDADDKIVGDFKLPSPLNDDMYQLHFGTGFTYLRPLLINNRKKWEYKGVLHEFLSPREKVNEAIIVKGDYYVESGRLGDRNKNVNKYKDDAAVLVKAYEKEINGDAGMASRYAFYCAQSYKDAGLPDDAIEWYKKCLTLHNWSQEKFYSALMIGTMYNKQNDKESALKYLCKTIEYDVERIDGIVGAMEILYNSGDHLLVNALYHRFKNYKKIPSEDKLFLYQLAYKDKIEYFNSISACYVHDKESGYICCKKILINSELIDHELLQTLKNMIFYKEQLENDNSKDIIALFTNVDKLYFKHKMQDETVSQIWKILYNKRTTILKSQLTDKKINAAFINTTNFIKIINLVRHEDRKAAITQKLLDAKVEKEKYQFMEATDGKLLQPNFGIKQLFRNNDFNYCKKDIGVTLSHIQIWKQLLSDSENDYYVILEDDITLCKKFNKAIMVLHHEFLEKEVIFLGYHMQKNIRDKLGVVYNETNVLVKDIKIEKFVKKIYFGGTFSYSINKMGAKKMLDAINTNGIQCTIDGFIKNTTEVECYESRPQLVFSKWTDTEAIIDSHSDNESINLVFPVINIETEYIFLQGMDQVGNDIIHYKNTDKDINSLIEYSSSIPDCVAFNTLGYLKSKIEKLEKIEWFSEKDGIYIKKKYYEQMLKGPEAQVIV